VDYTIDMVPKQKTVTIKSDPPGAEIVVEGAQAKPGPQGATAELIFPPVDDRGTLKTYKIKATRKTADAEWYPAELPLAWDDGKSEYTIKLREVLSQASPAMAFNFVRDKGEWLGKLETARTISMKFVTEVDGDQPQEIVKLNKGETIGALSVSPDGQNLVYSVVSGDEANPSSQMYRTRADGSSGPTALSDGRSIDLTPAYTAAGDWIVFASNRAGKKFSIWSIASDGTGGVRRLTTGDTNDIWPSVDAEAKPRLFYQAHIDTRSDTRLYMSQIGTSLQTDLTRLGGIMPRVSPKNDAVTYVLVNEKTGKRDIYRVSDRGGVAENLTNGSSDNTDPNWNFSGNQIVFSSDRGSDTEDKRANFDIYILELNGSQQPRRLTSNGSVDDMPTFDPAGDAIFFRSNRGGTWGIWKLRTK
ncbi:MAG: PD40 domain-containing protein, partial [Burkholderiales bacterium]|nr:PD40 domain-containing protein [Phycisphaerae bacterium]